MAERNQLVIVPRIPSSTFFRMSTELQLMTLKQMTPETYISFMFASYDILSYWFPDLVPPCRPSILANLITPPRRTSALTRLPAELLLMILKDLDMKDYMAFALSNYHALRDTGIAPVLSEETLDTLKKAMLREVINPLEHEGKGFSLHGQ
ncbi:hypothetical protein K402DRAFT_208538 [Aulographum hederae CBS 113979]|uniref:F-box domain-containing protein n=1 Tax=Aulographum hederae CBS 113979 TaxID=1176131 RepID=A0A6G1GMW8_9PEZI|nr:hypothetical protein K402DRAFT_208538 [Aulographum hederae CBS 113979]